MKEVLGFWFMEERIEKEERRVEWGIFNHGPRGNALPQYIFLRGWLAYIFSFMVWFSNSPNFQCLSRPNAIFNSFPYDLENTKEAAFQGFLSLLSSKGTSPATKSPFTKWGITHGKPTMLAIIIMEQKFDEHFLPWRDTCSIYLHTRSNLFLTLDNKPPKQKMATLMETIASQMN